MDILTAGTGKHWVSIAPLGEGDNAAKQKTQEHHERLNQLLTEILLSENLVVLAGLGTTAYIKDASGNPCAPTMAQLWAGAAAIAGNEFSDLKARVRYVTPEDGDNVELLLSHCQLVQQMEPSQLLSHQSLPHSFPFNGGWGYGFPNQNHATRITRHAPSLQKAANLPLYFQQVAGCSSRNSFLFTLLHCCRGGVV